jgi:cathepsin D
LIFGLADKISDEFLDLETDGICGLAFERLNRLDDHASTLITTLIKQKQINPLFSFHLSRISNFDDQGTLTLGGVDNTKFRGKINFNRVLDTPGANTIVFWLINVDDASINEKSLSFTGRRAVIDTGTESILMPDADAAKFHDQIPETFIDPESGFYIIPCNTTVVVAFKFNGFSYSLEPRDLILTPRDGDSCISNIFPGYDFDRTRNDIWLLGTPFLRNVYSVFRVENPSVGFAHNK